MTTITTTAQWRAARRKHYGPMIRHVLKYIILALMSLGIGAAFGYCF